MFTMSFFLILIIVFHGIKIKRLRRGDEKIAEKDETSRAKKIFTNAWLHITGFYSEESAAVKDKDSENDTSEPSVAASGVHMSFTT